MIILIGDYPASLILIKIVKIIFLRLHMIVIGTQL